MFCGGAIIAREFIESLINLLEQIRGDEKIGSEPHSLLELLSFLARALLTRSLPLSQT